VVISLFSFHFGQEGQPMPSHLSACRECGGSGAVAPFGEQVPCPFCFPAEERPPMPHYDPYTAIAAELELRAEESLHQWRQSNDDAERQTLLTEANVWRVSARLFREKAEREGER